MGPVSWDANQDSGALVNVKRGSPGEAWKGGGVLKEPTASA